MKAKDDPARDAAVRAYAQAYDRFQRLEDVYLRVGAEIEAAGCHVYALMAVRAYRAELDDPVPRGLVVGQENS